MRDPPEVFLPRKKQRGSIFDGIRYRGRVIFATQTTAEDQHWNKAKTHQNKGRDGGLVKALIRGKAMGLNSKGLEVERVKDQRCR